MPALVELMQAGSAGSDSAKAADAAGSKGGETQASQGVVDGAGAAAAAASTGKSTTMAVRIKSPELVSKLYDLLSQLKGPAADAAQSAPATGEAAV